MIPTFLYQVRDDPHTRPSDIQEMFDNIPVREKKLHRIDGTTRRWDGYTRFQREPRQMPVWFARFMAVTVGVAGRPQARSALVVL